MKKYILILALTNIVTPVYATIPVEDIGKDKIDELYKESILLKNLKKYNESKSLLMKIINEDPKQVDAYLLLSELEYLMGNWLEAIKQTKIYLKIIDSNDITNYLDISWAYFLIGESKNSMDYIIDFIHKNQNLLNSNAYVLIDTILKKGIYHFVEDEDTMFNLIINTIFQIETHDDMLYTLFLHNLNILKQIPFYLFNKVKIKELELQMRALKRIKNSTNDMTKPFYFS
ncbi:tetratricopeptide repeat protein [Borrelia sp. BU AG58]|uniref:tetratricopeptide repeat protein n=1 Tax=Borrelia sp. BU AG58 TaxID=2887345 RepID=UPI001E549429|nr:tetratricopeptide repeat protein [Borrelia sp. BU AG58]UER67502.1 tetratricopeptide repeat protein [Borrelia sp. BU AG58]